MIDKENDKRNVKDAYKGWETDLIREDVQRNTLPYAVGVQHWKGDYNLSTALRNANAFGAENFYYIGGSKRYDPRGAVGVQHYSNVKHLPTIDDLKTIKEKYILIGIENNINRYCVDMKDFIYPTKPFMFIFGEEGAGLTEEVMDLCDHLVFINMLGSVRSLNCGCASAIAMFDYVNKLNTAGK